MAAYIPRELPVVGHMDKHVGLWGREPLCPDAHTGQHLVGPTMMRIGAVVSGDPELLMWSGRLLRANIRLLMAVATPDLTVWSAGTRATEGVPTYFVGTAWLREVKKAPQLLAFDNPDNPEMEEKNWLDPMHIAVRGLRLLREMGDDLGGAANEVAIQGTVFTKHRFHVYRTPAEHMVVFDEPNPTEKGCCSWLRVLNNPAASGQVKLYYPNIAFGRDWESKAQIPSGASVMHIGPYKKVGLK